MVTEVIRPTVIRARPKRGRPKQTGLLNNLVKGAGWLLGKGISTMINGFGDYKVTENTLMTGGIDPPTVVNTVGNGGVIIRHREYLRDITATTAFNIQSFPLNPGLIASFPWLSAIAAHFEQYKFRGLLWEFKSLSSDAVLSTATSSALGSVVMATQYNALNPPFPDKFTMENYEFANSSKPSLSFIHPVECARKDTPLSELYTRSGDPPAGSDLRLFDLGTFSIATVGMQATSGVCGELWCTYEIELMKPKLQNPPETDTQADHFYLSTSATNPSPFIGNTAGATNTMGGILGNNDYHFPSNIQNGVFIVQWLIVGTPTASVAPTVGFINCVAYNLFNNNTASRVNSGGSIVGAYFDSIAVRVTAPNAQILYGILGTFPASPLWGDFLITSVPGNLEKITEEEEDSFGLTDPYQDDDQALAYMIHQMRVEIDNLKIKASRVV